MPKHRFIRRLVGLAAVLTAVVPFALSPSVASASPPCGLVAGIYYCYSEKDYSLSTTEYAVAGWINHTGYTLGNATGMETSIDMQLKSGHDIRLGWAAGTPLCGNTAYFYCSFAMVDNVVKVHQGEYADPNNHSYKIESVSPLGSGTYAFSEDGTTFYTSSDLGFPRGGTGAMSAHGGVASSTGLDSSESTGAFSIQALSWEQGNGAWYLWGTSWAYFINQPCGSYPVGQCLNGASYHDYQWDWNKP